MKILANQLQVGAYYRGLQFGFVSVHVCSNGVVAAYVSDIWQLPSPIIELQDHEIVPPTEIPKYFKTPCPCSLLQVILTSKSAKVGSYYWADIPGSYLPVHICNDKSIRFYETSSSKWLENVWPIEKLDTGPKVGFPRLYTKITTANGKFFWRFISKCPCEIETEKILAPLVETIEYVPSKSKPQRPPSFWQDYYYNPLSKY